MSERFIITELSLSGLILVQRKRMGDARGFFERLFCARELSEACWTGPIAQINHSYTANQGTVRGMHYQYPPHAEKKMIMCIKGQVYDVAIDIRKDSPTFLNWHAEILSPESSNALIIPEGFAHGFQSITPEVEMLYFTSEFYALEFEDGIRPDDPALNIPWPLKIFEISDKDRSHPLINKKFEGVVL